VNNPWHSLLRELKERFRLTSTEKRVTAFVLSAFLLGLITKCWREVHLSAASSKLDIHRPLSPAPIETIRADEPHR